MIEGESRLDSGLMYLTGGIFYSPALQRTRMATEAIYFLGKYVFDDLGYRRFQWKCDNANQKSMQAARRFGFIFEGVHRQHMIVNGANRDTAYFSIIDSEWARCKTVFEEWLNPNNFDSQGTQKTKLKIY